MSKFYVVATPIGNLEDVTFRAVGVLSAVDLILCEDTRVTARLLERYQITTPVLSYHAQSAFSKLEKVLGLIEDGKTLALVSDAGTPTISDPGVLLVSKIREKLPETEIIAVPGPSALAAALSISGLPASDFLFLGFLPHKKGRETLFKEIASSKRTTVFYESPHRIMKALESLKPHLEARPPSGRKIVVARELTKVFEEVFAGTPEEAKSYFDKNPDKVRGEFLVLVGV